MAKKIAHPLLRPGSVYFQHLLAFTYWRQVVGGSGNILELEVVDGRHTSSAPSSSSTLHAVPACYNIRVAPDTDLAGYPAAGYQANNFAGYPAK